MSSMQTSTKLAAYGAVLVAVLGAGAAAGAAVGPLDSGGQTAGHEMAAEPTTMASDLPGGLSASLDGFTLATDDTAFTPGVTEPFSFRILGPDGTPVTAFDTRHERQLHLVVVADDLGDYQHVHPTLVADGTWQIDLALPRAGGYRAYADFDATGAEPVTLAADLTAAGLLDPRPLPAPSTDATVDGYDVRLDGTVVAGTEAELRFTVSRDGAPVTDLQPYLGAFGHLAAIRAGDHAYLHVHPTDASSAEEVVFVVHAPSPGTYRLFLDVRHDDVVRTAAFSVDVASGDPTPNSTDSHGEDDHGDH